MTFVRSFIMRSSVHLRLTHNRDLVSGALLFMTSYLQRMQKAVSFIESQHQRRTHESSVCKSAWSHDSFSEIISLLIELGESVMTSTCACH